MLTPVVLVVAATGFAQVDADERSAATDEIAAVEEHEAQGPFTDDEALAAYLEEGGDPNAVDEFGTSLLVATIFRESLDGIRMLLDHGGNVNLKDPEMGMTPLAHACAVGSLEMVDLLLQRGANIKAVDRFGGNALEEAAIVGAVDVVQRLRELGLTSGHPLHVAAGIGDLATVEKLATDPQIVNQPTPGWLNTPLQFAVIGRQNEAAKLLLAKGADPNLPNLFGAFPLFNISGEKALAMCDLLLRFNASINARVGEGDTALDWMLDDPLRERLVSRGARSGGELDPGPELREWWKRVAGVSVDWKLVDEYLESQQP